MPPAGKRRRRGARQSSATLQFLLPGHRYIGPGNPVDNGEPVDRDDEIARAHDYAYEHARDSDDIRRADLLAIKDFAVDSVVNTNYHSAIGAVGLGAKYAIESFTGVLYPKMASKRGHEDVSGDDGIRVKRSAMDVDSTTEEMANNDSRHAVISAAPIRTMPMLIPSWTVKKSFVFKSWAFANAVIRPNAARGNLITTPWVAIPGWLISTYINQAEFTALPSNCVVKHTSVDVTPHGVQVSFGTNSSLSENATSQHVQYFWVTDNLRHKGYEIKSYTSTGMTPTSVNEFGNDAWIARRWGTADSLGMGDGAHRHGQYYWCQRAPYNTDKQPLLNHATLMLFEDIQHKTFNVFNYSPKYGHIKKGTEHQNTSHFKVVKGFGGTTVNGVKALELDMSTSNHRVTIPDKKSTQQLGCPPYMSVYDTAEIDIGHSSPCGSTDGAYFVTYPMIGFGLHPVHANVPNSDSTTFVNASCFYAAETSITFSMMSPQYLVNNRVVPDQAVMFGQRTEYDYNSGEYGVGSLMDGSHVSVQTVAGIDPPPPDEKSNVVGRTSVPGQQVQHTPGGASGIRAEDIEHVFAGTPVSGQRVKRAGGAMGLLLKKH